MDDDSDNVKCLACGADTKWDSNCPVCGWDMDSGMTTDDGEEAEPPNYFKVSDYRRFWEMSGKNRAKMREWWNWVANETMKYPRYWHSTDDDEIEKIYQKIIKGLEEHIKG
jgi:hypothetical protein